MNNSSENTVKRPLSRSITIVCVLFIGLLCLVLSFATYRLFTTTMYNRYEKQLTSIIDYIEAHIDHDDMAICADTFEESEKYREFQEFFDNFIDHYTDIHYLYIMKVADASDPIGVYEICAANSTYEKIYEPDMVLHLGDGEADWFSDETKDQLRKILLGRKDVFFEDHTTWGIDYTLARPVANSEGRYYGLLCADISIDEISDTIYRNIYISIGLILGLGLLFIILILSWMRSNVTEPIKKLQNSVTAFAEDSTGKRDPDDLLYTPPQINKQNEVASLSDAVSKLSYNMRDYVKRIVAAETEAKNLQHHVSEISTIAYHDPLTHVKNRAAFDGPKEAIAKTIADNTAEFGIVMIDINSLKVINDKCGHDKGNEYIVGSCNIICDIYGRDQVYRFGGDEFIVLLTGKAYANRDKLLEDLRDAFERAQNQEALPQWQRYSAAAGMAVYTPGDNIDVVLIRADQQMYVEKTNMKRQLNI